MTSRPPARIETARLVLRPWRFDDAAALHEALIESVDHLNPWIPWATPAPPTAADVHARLRTWTSDFEGGVNFVYAAMDRSETRLIGGIGLYRRVGPDAIEVGYWIRLAEAGRGFATEATRALTAVGFEMTGIARIEIHCAPLNAASKRVPAKLGFRLVRTRSHEQSPGEPAIDLDVFELSRDRDRAGDLP